MKECRGIPKFPIVVDPTSGGYNGTHTSDYVEGCLSRICCNDDCCGEGTRYDNTVESCIPKRTLQVVEVDFALVGTAAPHSVILFESIHKHENGREVVVEVTTWMEHKSL